MKLDGLKRVVTGFENGQAKITSVSPGGRILRPPDERGDNWAVCHWISAHPHHLDDEDLSETWRERLPPPSGSAFRISQFPPAGRPGSSFDFHTTFSVDYFVVLTGKLWLVLEGEEIELSAGDCVVQRGVPHRWENRSDEPCVAASVMIAAQDRSQPS